MSGAASGHWQRATGGILVALGGWEAAARLGVISAAYFPPPTRVLEALAGGVAQGALVYHTAATLGRLAGAFMLAAVPGLALGLVMGISPGARRVLDPYVAFLYPIPKVAMLPLLLILLGVGEPAFVATGALTAFFQIVVNAADGVQRVDPILVEVGRHFGARGFALFRKVILPAALPSILTGLRLGLGLSLITVIAVEFAIAKSGLGHLVWRSWQTLSTPEMFAALAVVGAIGVLLTRGLRRVQDRLLAWQVSVDVWS